ncbi:MAG: beta-ketoacyl-ACP synthase II [Candidatus Eisenbacteria bacterium]
MSDRRVVVTGLGVCAPNGVGIENYWSALIEGRSGVGPIAAFDASALRSRIAGEVLSFVPEDHITAKTAKRTARFTQLAVASALEAVRHAGLSGDAAAEARGDAAVVVGSGIGAFDFFEREHIPFLEKGPGRFHPLTVPIVIPNAAAGTIAMEIGCHGPNFCVTSACASGAHSIGTAFDLIRNGRANVALAGATESTISPFAVDGYCQLRALSTRNDDPAGASRPFSRDRDGFVIAEGAGILVLEELEHAKKRGAPILAELAGYGASADAHHMTAPEPEARGAVRAMRAALEDAKLAPEAIGLVNAHGTSTPLNDVIETMAIKTVFGAHARGLAVNATKSMTGHALGGAPALEAVAAVLMLSRGVIHPTINLHDPDPQCDLDYVPLVAREAKLDAVMSNSFGFGGHNAVLVFRRHPG